jgi:hypothetical protein
MKLVVNAGIIDPPLVPVGKGENYRKENGITVDDLFVDIELGTTLYLEIVAHALNKFSGLRGLFFSIRIRHMLRTEWRKSLRQDPLTSYSPTVDIHLIPRRWIFNNGRTTI